MARKKIDENEKKIVITIKRKYLLAAQAHNLNIGDYIDYLEKLCATSTTPQAHSPEV